MSNIHDYDEDQSWLEYDSSYDGNATSKSFWKQENVWQILLLNLRFIGAQYLDKQNKWT